MVVGEKLAEVPVTAFPLIEKELALLVDQARVTGFPFIIDAELEVKVLIVGGGKTS